MNGLPRNTMQLYLTALVHIYKHELEVQAAAVTKFAGYLKSDHTASASPESEFAATTLKCRVSRV